MGLSKYSPLVDALAMIQLLYLVRANTFPVPLRRWYPGFMLWYFSLSQSQPKQVGYPVVRELFNTLVNLPIEHHECHKGKCF
jgi:hypothetical protein